MALQWNHNTVPATVGTLSASSSSFSGRSFSNSASGTSLLTDGQTNSASGTTTGEFSSTFSYSTSRAADGKYTGYTAYTNVNSHSTTFIGSFWTQSLGTHVEETSSGSSSDSSTSYSSEIYTGTTSSFGRTLNGVEGSGSGTTTIEGRHSYTLESSRTTTEQTTVVSAINSVKTYTTPTGTTITTSTNSTTSTTVTTTISSFTQQNTSTTTLTTSTNWHQTYTVASGTLNDSFVYITGIWAFLDNIVGVVRPSPLTSAGRLSDICVTFTGSTQVFPIQIFTNAEVFTLPTKISNGTTSQVDTFPLEIEGFSSLTLHSENAGNIAKIRIRANHINPYLSDFSVADSYVSTNTSTANAWPTAFTIAGISFPSVITGYETVASPNIERGVEAVPFGFPPFTFTYIWNTSFKVGTVSDTTVIAALPLSSFDGAFSFQVQVSPFPPLPVVHTGFSTTSEDTGDSHLSIFSSTWAAGMGVEYPIRNADFSDFHLFNFQANDLDTHGELWKKIYYGSEVLVPNSQFSIATPGSNLSPDFPEEFVIPATYGSRADGPLVPIPQNSSTILDFIRNSTGGFGATVDSNLYTTFEWSHSRDSLSVTTKTSFSFLQGAQTLTSTVSSSTSTVLVKIGIANDTYYTYGNDKQFAAFALSPFSYRLPVGGKQKIGDGTLNMFPAYIIGTSYNNGISAEFRESRMSVETSVIPNEAPLSVYEFDTLWYGLSGNVDEVVLTIFDRNYTEM
jgi:hypothetical protein